MNPKHPKQSQSSIGLLEGLPKASRSESKILREVRHQPLDAQRIARLLAAMPQPSHEDLARRPVSSGEPFSL